ncbi:LysR family transcriptional regulator [Ramlibacter henchirensis]|uniref:LysR family transcriptional regulator n=1 Tax=Ramlibacter henchirensis TaxID=204072 RepID=A0A4Z0BTI2_9BURK|nr:LysR substrate-binding domain-containing protein [Ramlibacter henchirensis]TFZ02573.1 LysR family transcriptional regulator [Ramlibacter henchirensis]
MVPSKHIHVFRTVCHEGTVTRAAEVLRRTQSSVSRSVREIEDGLGVPLFERHGRGMLLTEFGKLLLQRVERAFGELESARSGLLEKEPGRRLRHAGIFSLSVNEVRLDVLQAFAVRTRVNLVARQLGVSQPAVSLAIRDIEAAAGFQVFNRNVSGVGLTPGGETLLLHVKRALAELRVAQAEIAAMKGELRGDVTVGTLPFARPYMLPVAVARLLDEHPGLRVATVEGPFETLVSGLLAGDLDFVIGVLRPVELHPELVREELFVQDMAVFARAGHPLARRKSLALKDIAGEQWVLARRRTPTRNVISALFERQQLPHPNVVVESSDLTFIHGLLLQSDMLTATSTHLFHQQEENGSLVKLPVALPGTSRPVGILRRTREHSSPGANLLIQCVREVRWPDR